MPLFALASYNMFYNNNVLWSTIPAAACKGQLRQLGESKIVDLPSPIPSSKPPLCVSLSFCLSSGNKRFLLYQETATQLVHCHTLTDFPSHTIHNHCDQLPSWSQMTVSICFNLCGIPCSDGRQSHLGIEYDWFLCYHG